MRDKTGRNNPNWKGGICSIRYADDALSLPETAQRLLRDRLENWKESATGCWEWLGPVFRSNGRARLILGRNNILASRLMYVLEFGAIGSLYVLHSCDNVLCIKPSHLSLGTSQDNADDMISKGRSLTGEKNAAAKLTEDQVRDLRRRIKQGELATVVAREYGITSTTAYMIRDRKIWRHV